MTPDTADAMFGLPAGTTRGWVRSGVTPPDPSEHAVIAAYSLRPAYSADAHDRTVAAHAEQVRASLTRAREAECPTTETTTGPAAPSAA